MTRQEQNKMRSDLFNAIKTGNTALAVQLAHNFSTYTKHGLGLCIRYNQPDVFDVLWARCASKDKIGILEQSIYYQTNAITYTILPDIDLKRHHQNIFAWVAVTGNPQLADVIAPYFSGPVHNNYLQSAAVNQNIDMVKYILPLCDDTPKDAALLRAVLCHTFNEEIAQILCPVSDVPWVLRCLEEQHNTPQEGIVFLQSFIAQQENEHIQQQLHATNTSRGARKI